MASKGNDELSEEHNELRKKLMATLRVFKARNWIDETEEDGFRSILSPNDKDNFVPSVRSLETMRKRLLIIKNEKLKEVTKSRKGRDKVNESTEENAKEKRVNERKIKPLSDISGNMNHEEAQNLFTELCVFSRMGMVNPTSCLYCVYKKSQVEDATFNQSKSEQCNNRVLWRKNANIPLHPEKLSDNLLILSCSTAKRLLSGKVVQDMKWDKKLHQVIKTE
mmetsp:Transcript_3138/g.4180  ORF Transcript_3138/g.4180 Transcript_3138/m.4180 type:complete len:222 (-) Transcript_3138:34-699(-)